jgi:hypothetical protein
MEGSSSRRYCSIRGDDKIRSNAHVNATAVVMLPAVNITMSVIADFGISKTTSILERSLQEQRENIRPVRQIAPNTVAAGFWTSTCFRS